MPFVPEPTKHKVKAGYKTVYLPQSLIDAVDDLAREHGTSFNNVVVSMIRHCLEESTQKPD